MKGVPGVMQLVSNLGALASGTSIPVSSILACIMAFCSASLAALNLLERCWFSLARGAGPSTIIKDET